MERNHKVKDGVYIPDTGIKYPDIPTTYIVPAEQIRKVTVDETYPFLDNSPSKKLRSFLYIQYAFCLHFP